MGRESYGGQNVGRSLIMVPEEDRKAGFTGLGSLGWDALGCEGWGVALVT